MDINTVMLKTFDKGLSNMQEVIECFDYLRTEYNKLYLEKERLKGIIYNKPEESKTEMEAKVDSLEKHIQFLNGCVKNLQTRKLGWKERLFGRIMF